MNPDEVVSEQWVNPTTFAPLDAKSNDPTYGKLTTFKDGRVTLTVYQRGTGNPAAGVPDQQVGEVHPQAPDKALKEAWDEAQKKSQTQTDQAERKVKRTYTGTDPQTGKPATVTEYESGPPKYDEIKPTAAASAHGAQTSKTRGSDPGGSGKQGTIISYEDGFTQFVEDEPKDAVNPKRGAPYKNAQGQWVRPITNPDGTMGSEPLPEGEIPAEDPKQTGGTIVQRNGKTYIVKPNGDKIDVDLPADTSPKSVSSVKGADGVTYTVAVDAQGNATAKPVEGLPANRPAPTERVDPANPRRRQRLNPQTGEWQDAGDVYVEEGTATIDGKPHRAVRDAQGRVTGYEEVPITGGKPLPPSATGWAPDATKPAYGLAERFRQYSEMEAAGTITHAQARQLYEQDKAVAEALVSQNNGILSTQSGLYSGGITQRGQDVSLANARLGASQSAITSSLSAADKMMLGGEAFKQLVNYYHSQAQKYGGLNDIPREQPGPAMQQVNRQSLMGAPAEYPGTAPGAPGATPSPGAPPQQPGPSPSELVMPAGSPGVPAGDPWLRPPVQSQPGGAGTVSITIQNGAGQQPQAQAQAAPQPPGQAYAKMLNQPDPALQQRLTSFQQELDADFQNELTGGGMLAGSAA